MAVSVRKQNYAETEEMLISYPKYQNHIYDTRDTRESVMSIVNIDGNEYETDGETCLGRKKQTAGYKVTLHFAESQNDISSVVQTLLMDEFIKGLKQE